MLSSGSLPAKKGKSSHRHNRVLVLHGGMSLERRLIVSVFLVLLGSLLVGAALTYAHAAHKVRTEMQAALTVGQHVVRNAVDDDEEQIAPVRRLALIIGDFNGDRHLRAWLQEANGTTTMQSTPQAPDDPAPLFFFALVGGTPATTLIELPPALRALGELHLETDARNEVSEAWSDLKLGLSILGVFFCLVLALIVASLRMALRPLQELSAALTRVGTGDYSPRLAWRNAQDLQPVQHGFNDMVAKLADMQMQNRLLQARVERVQEEERAEIARDLHDEVAPFLFAVSTDAALVRQFSLAGTLDGIEQRADAILDSVSHMQKHLREVLSRLMPDVLLDLGLAGAVESQVHFWRARKPDIDFVVDVTDEPLDDRSRSVAFRVVQESLSNAARHAEAAKICITVGRTSEGIVCEVSDDGRGMRGDPFAQGLGLLGMRERVRAIGGRFEIGQNGEGGVAVHAVLAGVLQGATA